MIMEEDKNVYHIYHAPHLKKVGCTKRLKKRLRDQKLKLGKHGTEVLAAIALKLGPRIAGDIEHLLAKAFGYRPGNHYDDCR